MRKLICLVMVASMLLTGCGKQEGFVDGIKKDLGWIVQEPDNGIIPEEAYQNGEMIFGNGKEDASKDLFGYLENKIWGDE